MNFWECIVEKCCESNWIVEINFEKMIVEKFVDLKR